MTTWIEGGWRRALAITLVVLVSSAISGRALPARADPTVWTARYDGARHLDEGESVAVSPDGTVVYVTGQSNGPYRNASIVTTTSSPARTGT